MTGQYAHSIDAKGRLFIPAALRREHQIKQLSRAQKDALRAGWPDQPSQGETEKETAPENETPQTL